MNEIRILGVDWCFDCEQIRVEVKELTKRNPGTAEAQENP
jgi:hypothetical protein